MLAGSLTVGVVIFCCVMFPLIAYFFYQAVMAARAATQGLTYRYPHAIRWGR